MSKELTPLQALEIICGELVEMDLLFLDGNKTNQKKWSQTQAYKKGIEFHKIYGSPTSIIETALKDTEKLKECYKNELKNSAYYNNLALKYKKVLEIIKEKILDMDYFNIIADRCDLTYQEYELLREVLK